MIDFSGQVAIVTGGSGGIGQAIVRGLARYGARVLVGYYHNEHAAIDTVAAVQNSGGDAQALAIDVREVDSGNALVAAAIERWGRVDILINSAGIANYGPFGEISSERWRQTIQTNLSGVYHTCRAVLRPMIQQRYGRIINIAALYGISGFPGQADFAAAAGGIIGLTRSLAREAAPWQITVNAVAPGMIETELINVIPPSIQQWSTGIIALRRLGKPEEVAAAVLFLASPVASYITGQTLMVDGGWTMA
ncbi:3-oxoacyl-ACP reductase family protein [Chloroflexus aggregans]|uniref:Peroxisomal trans-2-enoyl-CoA reductase n=1 Tax=Chloroflexus aggregans (strain MD-66 / DSM 9485) TaxID=326427 RepID=B8G6N5_CHLAD|nr:3-oxoacyl-ACP reductase family protein [Chloroflexus aggregans]ACL25844.1 short-chain dehydrogenase/reductase SDR [Chloroflexus aggregans DSM 9485]